MYHYYILPNFVKIKFPWNREKNWPAKSTIFLHFFRICRHSRSTYCCSRHKHFTRAGYAFPPPRRPHHRVWAANPARPRDPGRPSDPGPPSARRACWSSYAPASPGTPRSMASAPAALSVSVFESLFTSVFCVCFKHSVTTKRLRLRRGTLIHWSLNVNCTEAICLQYWDRSYTRSTWTVF